MGVRYEIRIREHGMVGEEYTTSTTVGITDLKTKLIIATSKFPAKYWDITVNKITTEDVTDQFKAP